MMFIRTLSETEINVISFSHHTQILSRYICISSNLLKSFWFGKFYTAIKTGKFEIASKETDSWFLAVFEISIY